MRVQNPAVAEVVSQLARGSKTPVKDGTLRQAISPYTYDKFGGNFESAPGPTAMDRVHPEAGTGPKLSMGQTPLMAVSPGGGPSTIPGPQEGYNFGAPRVSHTMNEKGMGVLTQDPEAVIDMLMAMGVPEPMIQQALMEMGYQK
jgi:hypothetical protein